MSNQFWNQAVEYVRTHGAEAWDKFSSNENVTKQEVMSELEKQYPHTLLIGPPASGKTMWLKNMLLADMMNEEEAQYIIISSKDDLKDDVISIKQEQGYKTTSLELEEDHTFKQATSFIAEQQDQSYLLFLTKKEILQDQPDTAMIERLLHHLFLQRKRDEEQIPLYIIIDEFQTLGDIRNISSFISMNNNSNMNFILSVQATDQLKAIYGNIEGQTILDHTKHFQHPSMRSFV